MMCSACKKLKKARAQRGPGEILVGDVVRCETGTPDGSVVTGQHYVAAKVSNGDVRSFIALADMPLRFWDAERFVVVA